SQTNPDGSRITLQYDSSGTLIGRTWYDAQGQVVQQQDLTASQQTSTASTAAQADSSDTSTVQQTDTSVPTALAQGYGQQQVLFEVNDGQVNDAVRFLSRGAYGNLFLTDQGATLVLHQAADSVNGSDSSGQTAVLTISSAGTNSGVQPTGED